MLDDGDHLAIVLRKEGDEWILSDEGHTYMHLTYNIDERDLSRGTRGSIIANALTSFSVEDRDGELRLRIPDHKYGDALYSFVQALLKVSDVTFLKREHVRSTFMEDLRQFLSVQRLPEIAFDWYDPGHDPQGKYRVDCRIAGAGRPVFVYGLPNDDKVRDATINLLQFENWHVPHHSVGIFEDQESVNRKVLARFSDVCEKLFSSLAANQERIASHLHSAVLN